MGKRSKDFQWTCRKSSSSYKNGCRCEDCRNAHRTVAREFRRKKFRPDTDWVPHLRLDPQECRVHLNWLRENGVGTTAIHRACGVDMNTLVNIREGHQTYVKKDTADRILSVGLSVTPSVSMVRKRVQELRDLGWTQRQLADASGLSTHTIYEIEKKERSKVWPSTAQRLLALEVKAPPPKK